MTLEQRVEALEKEMAAHKEAAQKQAASEDLIEEIIDGIVSSEVFSQLA